MVVSNGTALGPLGSGTVEPTASCAKNAMWVMA
jgi:hypothetical protein